MKHAETLFVYGTLMFPDIVKALTGNNYTNKKAILENYSVKSVKNMPYPGLIADDGKIVEGFVLLDVDDKTFNLIKDWEDSREYVEVIVNVIVDGKQLQAKTFAYISPNSITQITNDDWDRDSFETDSLEDYVKVRIPKYLKSK